MQIVIITQDDESVFDALFLDKIYQGARLGYRALNADVKQIVKEISLTPLSNGSVTISVTVSLAISKRHAEIKKEHKFYVPRFTKDLQSNVADAIHQVVHELGKKLIYASLPAQKLVRAYAHG